MYLPDHSVPPYHTKPYEQIHLVQDLSQVLPPDFGTLYLHVATSVLHRTFNSSRHTSNPICFLLPDNKFNICYYNVCL